MSETNSSTGLAPNIAALLCYFFSPVASIIFILIEKNDKFVRFHAFQSLFLFIALILLCIVLSFIPIIGWILLMVLPLAWLILWIVMLVKAYQGQTFKLPVIGEMSAKQAGL